jgi:hypothetical protein
MVTTAGRAVQDPTRAADAPPPTPVRAGDRGRYRYGVLLLLPLVFGFALRLALATTDDAPTTDETAYLSSGLSIWDGDGFRREGHPELHFPPLLPTVLGGAAEITDDPHEATVVVTLIAGTLLILPLAAIGRAAAGDRAGVTTAWLVALCPGLTTLIVNQGSGSEVVYTLLLATGLWLVVTKRGDPSLRWRAARAGGAGVCIALAYLTRPEGLLLAAVFLPFLVVGALGGGRAIRRWRVSRPPLRAAGIVAVAFVVPIIVFAAPYVSYLHDKTGRWELTAKTQDASIEAWRAVAEGDRRSRDEVLYALDESGTGFAADRSSLPALVRDDPTGYLGIVGVNLGRLADSFAMPRMEAAGPAWVLLPLPVTALAVWLAWRRRRERVVVAILLTAAVPIVTALLFFVQPRYLIPPVALVSVLAGIAMADLPRRFRGVAWVIVAVLFAFGLAAGATGGRWVEAKELTDHREAGEWIAANTDPDDRIMTRSMVAEFYADRRAVALPDASYDEILSYARHYGVQYVVADQSRLATLRPQLIPLLREGPWPGLQLVYDNRVEGRRVRVFALDPRAEAFVGDAPSLGFVGDGQTR